MGTWVQRADYIRDNYWMSTGALLGKLHVTGGAQSPREHRAYTPLTDSWDARTDLPGVNRWNIAAAVHEEKWYLTGGSTASSPRAELYCYEPLTNTWTTRTPVPVARGGGGPCMEAVGDALYLIGGYRDQDQEQNKTERYDVPTDTWSLCADIPGDLTDFACSLWEDEIFTFGGLWNGFSSAVSLKYTPATDTWAFISDKPNASSNIKGGAIEGVTYIPHSAVVGEIYETHAYTHATDSWHTATPMPNDAWLIQFAVGVVDDRMYVVGGRDQNTLARKRHVWEFTPPPPPSPPPPKGAWTRVGTVPMNSSAALEASSGTSASHVFYVDHNRNDRFNPVTETWDSRAPGNWSTTRVGHKPIASLGDELHVLGGEDWAIDRHDAFDDTTNTWSLMPDLPSLGNPPWKGALVYEGDIYVTHVNAIVRFDRAANVWSVATSTSFFQPFSTTDALGDRLYGVGAYDDGYALHVYDPASDIWTQEPSTPNNEGGGFLAAAIGALFHGGGRTAANPSDLMVRYTPETKVWSEDTLMLNGRYRPYRGVINGAVYVTGGFASGGIARYVDKFVPGGDGPDPDPEPIPGEYTAPLHVDIGVTRAYTSPVHVDIGVTRAHTAPMSVDVTVHAEGVYTAPLHADVGVARVYTAPMSVDVSVVDEGTVLAPLRVNVGVTRTYVAPMSVDVTVHAEGVYTAPLHADVGVARTHTVPMSVDVSVVDEGTFLAPLHVNVGVTRTYVAPMSVDVSIVAHGVYRAPLHVHLDALGVRTLHPFYVNIMVQTDYDWSTLEGVPLRYLTVQEGETRFVGSRAIRTWSLTLSYMTYELYKELKAVVDQYGVMEVRRAIDGTPHVIGGARVNFRLNEWDENEYAQVYIVGGMREERVQFQRPEGGWERSGRHVSLELEEA